MKDLKQEIFEKYAEVLDKSWAADKAHHYEESEKYEYQSEVLEQIMCDCHIFEEGHAYVMSLNIGGITGVDHEDC